MAVTVRIPSVLRNLTAGKEMISVQAATIAQAVEALDAAHPGIKAKVLGADGKMGGFSANGGVSTKRRMLEIEGAPAVGAGPLFAQQQQ